MLNNLVLFLGLLLLIFISSFSLSHQMILFLFLFLVSLKTNVSITHIFYRIKFFLLSLILIYALSIPGEILFYYYFISVSYEGIAQAFFNSLRLLNIFSLVAIMMSVLPKKYLIVKIIKFADFFSFFGLNKDRLSARLFLTFEYFELFKNYQFKFSTFTSELKKILAKDYQAEVKIMPESVALNHIDFIWIVIFVSVASLIVVFL